MSLRYLCALRQGIKLYCNFHYSHFINEETPEDKFCVSYQNPRLESNLTTQHFLKEVFELNMKVLEVNMSHMLPNSLHAN